MYTLEGARGATFFTSFNKSINKVIHVPKLTP